MLDVVAGLSEILNADVAELQNLHEIYPRVNGAMVSICSDMEEQIAELVTKIENTVAILVEALSADPEALEQLQPFQAAMVEERVELAKAAAFMERYYER